MNKRKKGTKERRNKEIKKEFVYRYVRWILLWLKKRFKRALSLATFAGIQFACPVLFVAVNHSLSENFYKKPLRYQPRHLVIS